MRGFFELIQPLVRIVTIFQQQYLNAMSSTLNHRQFFEHYRKHFVGTELFIEDCSNHPYLEIHEVSEEYKRGKITETDLISSLASLTVFFFRFTKNGEVWNPTKESFHSFTNGTFRCICAQCPNKIYERSTIEKFLMDLKSQYETIPVIFN